MGKILSVSKFFGKTLMKPFSLILVLFQAKFYWIFLFLTLIQISIISIQSQSVETALLELGPRMLNPTLEISEISQTIIANGKATFFNLWDLFIQGVFVLGWIKALAYIFLIVIQDTSKKPSGYLFGVIMFITIQSFYLLITEQSDRVLEPVFAFKDLWDALPSITSAFENRFTNASELAEPALQKIN